MDIADPRLNAQNKYLTEQTPEVQWEQVNLT